jgi:hypothetical protein
MRSRGAAVAVLLAVAAAGVLYYRHWSSPQQVMARLQARMDREAERVVEDLPGAIANGAGTERLAPGSPARRVVFAARGARVEYDAGPGRLLASHGMWVYREKNGEPGRQQGEPVFGSHEQSGPTDPAKRTRADWLQSTDGFGADRPFAERRSVELRVAVAAPGSHTEQVSTEWFAPAIDLEAPESAEWHLLWRRANGPTLEWRRGTDVVELRWREVPDDESALELVVGAGAPSRVEVADGSASMEAPLDDLADLADHGLRSRIVCEPGGSMRLEITGATQ